MPEGKEEGKEDLYTSSLTIYFKNSQCAHHYNLTSNFILLPTDAWKGSSLCHSWETMEESA